MDVKRYAVATQRNREPILKVLQKVLPSKGNILEIASGTGEHAVFFAERLQGCQWYPSDRDPQLRASIEAWSQECPTDNLHPPLDIDASSEPWSFVPRLEKAGLANDRLPRSIETAAIPIDAIVNINMIHIAPFAACEGLMAGAERILHRDGILYLYGPYKRFGKHTSASNEVFDKSLRDRDPQWGVRQLEDVIAVAKEANLVLQEVIAMPANNLSVIFRKK